MTTRREELVKLRVRAGFSQEALAEHLQVSRSSIARWERGPTEPYPRVRTAYAAALGVTVAQLEVVLRSERRPALGGPPVYPHADRSTDPTRRQVIAGLSAMAFDALALGVKVPNSKRLSHPTPIEHFAELRQTLIDADAIYGGGHVLAAVCDQAVQLDHLRRAARPGDVKAVTRAQAEFAELAGWITQDLCDYASSLRWLDHALMLAEMSESRDTVVFVLSRRSQLAADMGDAGAAVLSAQRAGQLAEPGSRTTVLTKVYGGNGMALAGEPDDAYRLYEEAQIELESARYDDTRPWMSWLDDSYLQAQYATCLLSVDEYEAAADEFDHVLEQLSAAFHRERGLYLARAARAKTCSGEIDDGVRYGSQALDIAATSTSARLQREVRQLVAELQHRAGPEVDEFVQAASAALKVESEKATQV